MVYGAISASPRPPAHLTTKFSVCVCVLLKNRIKYKMCLSPKIKKLSISFCDMEISNDIRHDSFAF